MKDRAGTPLDVGDVCWDKESKDISSESRRAKERTSAMKGRDQERTVRREAWMALKEVVLHLMDM